MGIPDKVFSLFDSWIIQVVSEINIMPLLVLCCRICPKNMEGTMFAILMSVFNLASTISYYLGSLLIYLLNITQKNFKNLWILILLANIFAIIPLFFIGMVNIEKANAVAFEWNNNEEKTKTDVINRVLI